MISEVASWLTEDDFRYSIKYGQTPVLSNVKIKDDGLRVVNSTRKATATYIYDFGRIGHITKLTWYGIGIVYFRVKAANTEAKLNRMEYDGSHSYNFAHTVLDTDWNVTSNDYSVQQNNGGVIIIGTKL